MEGAFCYLFIFFPILLVDVLSAFDVAGGEN